MEKTCPKCGVKATGKKEIQKIFNFRTRTNGLVNPQSNCVKCRGDNAKKMNRKIKKDPRIAKLDMRTKKAKAKLKTKVDT